MFAVVKTGGKQYRVMKDDVIHVEKLAGEAGQTVELTDILMIGDDKSVTVGTPTVAGAAVSAEVVEQTRGDKVIIFKKRRRHTYRRTKGHRQYLTALKITDIAKKRKAASTKVAEGAQTAEPAPAQAEPQAGSKTAGGSKTATKKASGAKTKTSGSKSPGTKSAGSKASGSKASGGKASGTKSAGAKSTGGQSKAKSGGSQSQSKSADKGSDETKE